MRPFSFLPCFKGADVGYRKEFRPCLLPKCSSLHGLDANQIQPNSHIYSCTIIIYVDKYAASDHDAIDRGIYLVIIPWHISIIRYEPKAIELHVIMCIEKTALGHSFE